MKKVILLLMVFLYLIPAIGVTVSAHYCGGTLASISIPLTEGKDCDCSEDSMAIGCCKNESKTFKFKDAQQKTIPFSINLDNFLTEVIVYLTDCSIQSLFIDFDPYNHHHPPDTGESSIFILHNTFRI